MSVEPIVILGAGVTGLAAGYASGFPIFESNESPGGICSSYYLRPGETQRLAEPPTDGSAYRFELGGGHWIFGGDSEMLRFIQNWVSLKSYKRASSVFLTEQDLLVPYPIQNHLRYLDREFAAKAIEEISCSEAIQSSQITMAEWLEASFGKTLCNLFFHPFHQLYTAGLWQKIAPQDAYKSPISLPQVIAGASNDLPPVGYNVTFVYPEQGLNAVVQHMAARCKVQYGKRVIRIDMPEKVIYFADGSNIRYDKIISTLPLNRMVGITGLEVDVPSDPFTSVLVLNIGAVRGMACPNDHWVYISQSQAGFHRVGFYSHVDASFLPKYHQSENNRVSLYIERAYVGGQRPTEHEIQQYCDQVVQELQSWGWIQEVDVIDPTWIDVAYTWSLPGSTWRKDAIAALHDYNIESIGRYGRWVFQGIADSIREGLTVKKLS